MLMLNKQSVSGRRRRELQKSRTTKSARQNATEFLFFFVFQLRQRDPTSKADRYMLMGYDEYPKNVKVSLAFGL